MKKAKQSIRKSKARNKDNTASTRRTSYTYINCSVLLDVQENHLLLLVVESRIPHKCTNLAIQHLNLQSRLGGVVDRVARQVVVGLVGSNLQGGAPVKSKWKMRTSEPRTHVNTTYSLLMAKVLMVSWNSTLAQGWKYVGRNWMLE